MLLEALPLMWLGHRRRLRMMRKVIDHIRCRLTGVHLGYPSPIPRWGVSETVDSQILLVASLPSHELVAKHLVALFLHGIFIFWNWREYLGGNSLVLGHG
jgi:hypothetical protein